MHLQGYAYLVSAQQMHCEACKIQTILFLLVLKTPIACSGFRSHGLGVLGSNISNLQVFHYRCLSHIDNR
jgi:hypothetical protein